MRSAAGCPVLSRCKGSVALGLIPCAASGDMTARPAAFGIATETVDGQDVRAVYAAASRAVARGRAGEGPTFILCNTYRYHGHYVGDISRDYYRSKEEEQRWRERDPIAILEQRLIDQGLADRA